MKKNTFYKTSSHGGVGSTAMFHAINGAGYVTDLAKAHVFTREEMQKEADNKWFDNECIPLSVDHVNELATIRVDCQYINENDQYPNNKDACDEYVSYEKRRWDGNDLLFASVVGGSFDYSKARVYNAADFDGFVTEWVFISKAIVDAVARKTFQTANINRRKMISGAGVIGIRKIRESQSKGLARWNCPCCGKISWQLNPYDFDGCKDISCDGWTGYDSRVEW